MKLIKVNVKNTIFLVILIIILFCGNCGIEILVFDTHFRKNHDFSAFSILELEMTLE